MITLEQIKAKLLEQPAVQAEYDALAAEFDATRASLTQQAQAAAPHKAPPQGSKQASA